MRSRGRRRLRSHSPIEPSGMGGEPEPGLAVCHVTAAAARVRLQDKGGTAEVLDK